MSSRAVALALVAILAGCLGEGPAAPAGEGPGAGAPRAEVALEAPRFRAPVLLGNAGPDGAEPNVLATPDGRVYVLDAPSLWRSLDGGRTFQAVGEAYCDVDVPLAACPPGHGHARSGLDSLGDMDFAADANGTLYFAGLLGESGAVPFQRSSDGGETWSEPIDLAEGNDSDREWIDALPNGTVYVTWRDFGAPDAEDPPERLLFRRSPDGGATWGPLRVIRDDALQGPLAHDPASGALYTAFYDGGIQVARSLDEGETWTFHEVAREERDLSQRGNPTHQHVVTAVDAAGTVYVVWSQDSGTPAPDGTKGLGIPRVRLAVSTDRGESWTPPVALSPEGRVAVQPWIVAGQPGRVAVAWYEGRHGVPSEVAPDVWDVMLVESVTADGPDPVFVGGPANAEPVHVGAICTEGGRCDRTCRGECVPTRICFGSLACAGRDRSRLDLFEMALRPDGHPVLAWVADADPSQPATGVRIFVGGVESGTPIG